MSPGDSPQPFETGGRFEPIRRLGRGGQGETWIARDRDSGDVEVLLKQVVSGRNDPRRGVSLRNSRPGKTEDWQALRHFEGEAKTLGQLDHPSIPKLLDFVPAEEAGDLSRAYMVQELAPGESLETRLEGGWRAGAEEAADIAAQVLEILAYLHGHANPVVHRDLKPANLIMDDAGGLCLVDFGAACRAIREEDTVDEAVAGTYGFMAPEQFQGRAEPRSDLYGLGATVVKLLTGRDPGELPHRDLSIDLDLVDGLPDRLRPWIERLLEALPEERHQGADAALAALRRARDDDGADPGRGNIRRVRELSHGIEIEYDVGRADKDCRSGVAFLWSLVAFPLLMFVVFVSGGAAMYLEGVAEPHHLAAAFLPVAAVIWLAVRRRLLRIRVDAGGLRTRLSVLGLAWNQKGWPHDEIDRVVVREPPRVALPNASEVEEAVRTGRRPSLWKVELEAPHSLVLQLHSGERVLVKRGPRLELHEIRDRLLPALRRHR